MEDIMCVVLVCILYKNQSVIEGHLSICRFSIYMYYFNSWDSFYKSVSLSSRSEWVIQ